MGNDTKYTDQDFKLVGTRPNRRSARPRVRHADSKCGRDECGAAKAQHLARHLPDKTENYPPEADPGSVS